IFLPAAPVMVTSAGSEGADRASRGIRTMAAMMTTRTPIITVIARRSCRRIERSMVCAVWLFVSTRKGPLLDASSRCRHSTLDRSGLAGNRTRCLTSARKTLFPTHHRLAHRKRYVSCIVNGPFDGASVISGNLVRSSSGSTIVSVSTTHGASDYSGVVEIPVSELRDRLGETLEQVDREDTFVYVTRHGRRIGAIMPADIAERYEDMEDAYWS